MAFPTTHRPCPLDASPRAGLPTKAPQRGRGITTVNQEQIIKMALDSGMAAFKHSVTVAHVTDLERFALIVTEEKDRKIAELEDLILELKERIE